jgi:short-subunit dehydrogenase
MNDIAKRMEPLTAAVVITGATQGVGRALAEEFARDGHALLLVARDETKLAATARSLAETYGVGVKYFSCDLCTAAGCTGVEEALRRHGFYADVLVNNAALMTAGFFQDQDPAKLRQIVDLDVQAVVDLTRRFLPGMIARGRGGVLNVASVEGFMPIPYQATYAAAKAFVLSFSRALAYETMFTGVRVSALAPGTTTTAMHAKAGAEHSRYVQLVPVMSPEDVARIGYRKFKRGKKIIVTGWFNRLSVLAQRFTPHFALVPFMGWLFRVRDAQGNLQMPRVATAPKPAKKRLPVDSASDDGPSLAA